jgi:hypothetical protein
MKTEEEIVAELKSVYGDLTQRDLAALKIIGESVEMFNTLKTNMVNSDLASLVEEAKGLES